MKKSNLLQKRDFLIPQWISRPITLKQKNKKEKNARAVKL